MSSIKDSKISMEIIGKVSMEENKDESSPEFYRIHQIGVVDFAAQGGMQRRSSVKKMFTPAKAKYTKRGKFSQWIENF